MDNGVSKALRLIGLAKRARRVEAGEQPAGRALKSGHGKLAIVADGASENTARRFKEWADEAKVELLVLPCTKEQLGAALGVQMCAMAVITDAGLAGAIRDTQHGGGTI